MESGEDAILYKKNNYYEDMTKFGQLGLWILTSMGAKDIALEDLIGDIPTNKIKTELTEEEKELIEISKQTGLKYKITPNGVKIFS